MKKIWLITGISSGLGEALAQTVMANGDFVIGTFRRGKQVETFNSTNNGNGYAYLLDLNDPENIGQMVSDIKQRFDKVDILVNNAGNGFVGAVEETSLNEVRDVFEVNFFGGLCLTRLVLPMMRREHTGHIFQISSHSGFKGSAGFGIYNATKFALEGYSEALAQELEPLGIKVTIVEPGPFRTNFAGSNLREAAELIPDYADTAGVFRNRLKAVNGKQEGHPGKAANAIYNASVSGQRTLRLPLGTIAVNTIQAKLDQVAADLAAHRETALKTVY